MAKLMHKGRRKSLKTVAHKARAEMYFDVLNKQVSQFKDSEEGRRIMCKVVEEFAERRAAESKRENMLATAKRMLKDGILALKDIARYSGLSLAQVKKLQAAQA